MCPAAGLLTSADQYILSSAEYACFDFLHIGMMIFLPYLPIVMFILKLAEQKS